MFTPKILKHNISIPLSHNLRCINLDDSLDNNDVIIVKVSLKKPVDSLRIHIKERLAPLYNNVPSNKLFLYKSNFNFNEVVETYRKGGSIPITLMNPQEKFSKYFNNLKTIIISNYKMKNEVSRAITNEQKKISEDQAKQLREEQEVCPVEDINILQELERISEEFWNKYGKYPISCVSPAMINKEAALTVLVKQPEDANHLPATFKDYRVFIEYGEIE